MDDRAFDELLRDALAQANLEDGTDLRAPAEEPDFSPAYRQDRMRLLADPQKWYRRRQKKAKTPLLRRVAGFAVVCVLSVALLSAVSPDVRASLLLWTRSQEEEYTQFKFPGTGEAVTQTVPEYALTALPEGFAEAERGSDSFGGYVTYENGDGCHILLRTNSMEATSSMFLDSGDAEIRSVMVNGCAGEMYVRPKPKTNTILWMDEEAMVSFSLQAPMNPEGLLVLAESVEEIE